MLHCLLANECGAHSAMRPVSSVWQRVRSRSSRRMSLALRSPCRKDAGTSRCWQRWRRQMLAGTPRPADHPLIQHHGAAADEDLDGIWQAGRCREKGPCPLPRRPTPRVRAPPMLNGVEPKGLHGFSTTSIGSTVRDARIKRGGHSSSWRRRHASVRLRLTRSRTGSQRRVVFFLKYLKLWV